MELNYYKSIKQPTIVKNITVDSWLSDIKNGSSHSHQISKARTIGKNNPGYDQIKENLPAVTWNFKFNKYKKDSNIIGSSGYMYFDIDDTSFSESFLDKSKVFCFFSSLSNLGKSIIVKVSGVTQSNFNSTYESIAQDLNISSYMDLNAIKKTQYTVISQDSNLFLNNESPTYSAIEPVIVVKEKKVQSHTNLKKEGEIHIGTDCTFLKFNDLDLYSNPDDVVVNPDGWDVIELYLPAQIKEGKRKTTLLAYCNNLVLLNPNKTPGEIYSHLMERNIKRCNPALGSNDVADVVNSIFKYKAAGSLNKNATKKRKIIFGKNCGMDKEDKKSFVNQQIGEWKKNKTKKKIYDAIESLDCKVTAKTVAEKTGISLRTVKTYWSEFKEYVKQINQK